MIVGIVGSEARKFTPFTEKLAREVIRNLVQNADTVCSGHCHLGGVDIYAEEEAKALGKKLLIYPPAKLEWRGGYRERNLQIAEACDEVYCITVSKLPADYRGMRFSKCYHCGTTDHVKSGGCWTVKQAKKLGKKTGVWIVGEEGK